MNAQKPTVLLRLSQVIERTGRKKTFIYAEIRAGRFPKPVKDGTVSLWVEAEIESYNQALIAKRDMGKDMGRDQAA